MKQAALLIFISLFFFCFNLKAQEAQTSSPIVSIKREVAPYTGNSRNGKKLYESEKRMLESDRGVCSSTRILFTAKVSDELNADEKSKIKYVWIISGGEILEGQNTSSVIVGDTESSGMIEIIVALKNLPKKFSNRKNQASSSVNTGVSCDWTPCSMISIESPEFVFDTDKTFTVRAKLDDIEMEETAVYEWEITNGYIIEGQGTKEIKVVFQGTNDGDKCVITLKIKDEELPPECPSTGEKFVTLRKKNLFSANLFNFF